MLSAFFYSQVQQLPSRKFKRDHVCAICDGCHGLTLAGFGNTPHVSGPEHVGTNAMYYTTRLLVFLAVTGGLAAAIVLSLSGELITRLLG